MPRKVTDIEISTVKNFDEIQGEFTFLLNNIPFGYKMIDFDIIEVKDGYILKSTIAEEI